MKSGIKTVGIDDGHFTKDNDKETLVVGAVVRGNIELEGVLRTHIEIDGCDATEKIIEMIKKSRHYRQLKAVFTNSIMLGGLNILDINQMYEELGISVIAVLRKEPNIQKLVDGIKERFPEKAEILVEYGKPKRFGKIYYYSVGKNVEELIKITTRKGSIPEPIRLAHLIATGVTLGESRGRA